MKPLLLIIGLCLALGLIGFFIGQRTPSYVSDGTFSWWEISQRNKAWYDLGKQVGKDSVDPDQERNYYNGYVDGKASCSQQLP